MPSDIDVFNARKRHTSTALQKPFEPNVQQEFQIFVTFLQKFVWRDQCSFFVTDPRFSCHLTGLVVVT